MPTQPTYPGVYIEEVPSAVRTIVGVSTSVTAFIGYTKRGPTDKAVQLFNFGDFEREFGGLDADSPVSYGVQQFFMNGGIEAWVVRVAAGAGPARVEMRNAPTGAGLQVVLRAEARTGGVWGNNLRLEVDYDTANPMDLFNLTVTELVVAGGQLQPGNVEQHRNLTMEADAPNDAVKTINSNSKLLKTERGPGATSLITTTARGSSRSGALDPTLEFRQSLQNGRVLVWVDGKGPFDISLGANVPADLAAVGTAIRDGINAVVDPDIPAPTVAGTAPNQTIEFRSATADEHSSIRFANAGQNDVARILKLGVANGGVESGNAAVMRPAVTGTAGDDLDTSLAVGTGTGLASLDRGATSPSQFKVNVRRGTAVAGGTAVTLTLLEGADPAPSSKEELAGRLQQVLRDAALENPQFQEELATARVLLEHNRLRVVAGGTGDARLVFEDQSASDRTAAKLGITGSENVPRYVFGTGSAVRAQTGATSGSDGTPPGPNELRGERNRKTGIYALEDVDIFNILCIPPPLAGAPGDGYYDPLISEAMSYCEEQRAFLIVDLPIDCDDKEAAQQWIRDAGTPKSKNAAAYFPWVRQADALQQFRLRQFPPSGMIAGLYARTDGTRGVWKAPAGTEAALRGPRDVEYKLSDRENGTINPLGLNAIRSLPVFGNVVWGARTLYGADQMASEHKYIPVRRTTLFIEESLYRGTQWVVFEPNDEPLWAQIRLNAGAFMHNLFRQGAFQGASPRDAYLVKCDGETTTQNDINLGIVNILVGFAPLKPAEFVIIKISQLAGQMET